MRNIGKVVAIVLVVLVLLLLLGGVGMMGFGGWRMMGGYGMHWPGMMFGWGLGGLFMLLFWVLVIGGLVWLVRALARPGATTWVSGPSAPLQNAPAQSPLDILKLRYARGEITREQFEQMKRDLGLETASTVQGER